MCSRGKGGWNSGGEGGDRFGLVGGIFEAVANISVARKSPGLTIRRPDFSPSIATIQLCDFRSPLPPAWASISSLLQ